MQSHFALSCPPSSPVLAHLPAVVHRAVNVTSSCYARQASRQANLARAPASQTYNQLEHSSHNAYPVNQRSVICASSADAPTESAAQRFNSMRTKEQRAAEEIDNSLDGLSPEEVGISIACFANDGNPPSNRNAVPLLRMPNVTRQSRRPYTDHTACWFGQGAEMSFQSDCSHVYDVTRYNIMVCQLLIA